MKHGCTQIGNVRTRDWTIPSEAPSKSSARFEARKCARGLDVGLHLIDQCEFVAKADHPFAGAKGDNGRSFNVAFRSAKGCIGPSYPSPKIAVDRGYEAERVFGMTCKVD